MSLSLDLNVPVPSDPTAWMASDHVLSHASQRIVLRLDPEGRKAAVEIHSNDIGGFPESFYHLRELGYLVDRQVDATRFKGWLEERSGILRRICDGHTIEWNGSDYGGKLTSDAQEASAKLRRALDPTARRHGVETDLPTHDASLMQASTYLTSLRGEIIEYYQLSAGTSDEHLREIARDVEEVARSDAQAKLIGTLRALEDLRDELRRERALA